MGPNGLSSARGVARVDEGLVQRLAVDVDRAGALALHRVAADRDDPLDQVLLLRGRHQADEAEGLLQSFRDRVGAGGRGALQPAARVVEDDDLAARGLGAEPRGQLVDQDPVTALQGVLHRVRRDRERLDQERLDESARTSAMTMRIGSSFQKDRCFFASPSCDSASCGPAPPSPGTSALPPWSGTPPEFTAASSSTALTDGPTSRPSGSPGPDREPTTRSPTSTPHSAAVACAEPGAGPPLP